MNFETLKIIVAGIRQAANEALESNDIPQQDEDFTEFFISSMLSDITIASDTSSTLPESMNDAWKYVYAVFQTLRCYATFLNSGCCVRIDSSTKSVLEQLLSKQYMPDQGEQPTTMRSVMGAMDPGAYD